MESETNKTNQEGISRRDILTGLASLPILGIVGYGLFKSHAEAEQKNSSLLSEIKPEIPAGIPALIDGYSWLWRKRGLSDESAWFP